uniref:O-fucosyltransferase family protein n=1 Tax=Fagus sylvatica TaxID=28930 RepID=A0A2N9G4K2_FAGSY
MCGWRLEKVGMGAKGMGTADEIKALLGDYDAIHVRRGDKIKNRKDRFGVERSLHPHLDRDTRPEFILRRIKKYKLAYSSNYSRILDPLIENNYQLFIAERLIMMGAKTFIKTFKEDETSLSLTDDPKKNTKSWQIPVYTLDEEFMDLGCDGKVTGL